VTAGDVLCVACLEPISPERLARECQRQGVTLPLPEGWELAVTCSPACAAWKKRGYPEFAAEIDYAPGEKPTLKMDRTAGAVVMSLAAGQGGIIHIKPGVDPVVVLAHIYGLAQTLSNAIAEGAVEELTEEDEKP
jgi:hypothetical protein